MHTIRGLASFGRSAVALSIVLAIGACTATSSGPPAPTVDGSPTTQSRPPPDTHSSVRKVMELPKLPARGIVAMWSRPQNATGVSFVTTQGDIITAVRNANISEPAIRPGPVILEKQSGRGRFFLLLPKAHQLDAISELRAYSLQRTTRPVSLPTPTGGSGRWSWLEPSPNRAQVLGQWMEQISECELPIAAIQRSPGTSPEPFTGGSLPKAPPSYALGWTSDGRAIVHVAAGPCVGPSGWHPGVYIFNAQGNARRIPMPSGSYAFRMWGSRSFPSRGVGS